MELTCGGVQSGLGNLVGLERAGFKPIFQADYRKFMHKSELLLETAFPDLVFFPDMKDVLRFDDSPTIIVSSPSCAQLSNLGIKRKDREQIKKGSLPLEEYEFVQTLKILLQKEPEFFVIEYLPTLLKHFHVTHEGLYQESTDTMFEFPTSKYNTQIVHLDAVKYGIPQRRKRLFIILSKKRWNFTYTLPMLMHRDTYQTVGELLAHLDELRREGSLIDDDIPKHSAVRIQRFSELQVGESYYGGQNNTRMDPLKISPVITSHCTQHVHPWESRILTPRETATIQGFPTDFKFDHVTIQIKYDLIGRSIPPPITQHIGEEIKERIHKVLEREKYAY